MHKERTIFNPSVCCDCLQKAHPQEGPILQGTRPQGPKTSLATQPLASTRTIKSAAFVYVSLAPLCRWRNTGANTLKGENCVKRQGSSSDKMIAAICSILPTSSCLKESCFCFRFWSQTQEHMCPTDPSHPSFPGNNTARLV